MNLNIIGSRPQPMSERRVEVYRNLHKNCYSVRVPHGKVVAHLSEVVLNDCKLAVQQARKMKVRRQKRKNVHAFIRGYFSMRPAVVTSLYSMEVVTYDPYIDDSFVVIGQNGIRIPVYSAKKVCLTTMGVFAKL
jgi:hypothetical protein